MKKIIGLLLSLLLVCSLSTTKVNAMEKWEYYGYSSQEEYVAAMAEWRPTGTNATITQSEAKNIKTLRDLGNILNVGCVAFPNRVPALGTNFDHGAAVYFFDNEAGVYLVDGQPEVNETISEINSGNPGTYEYCIVAPHYEDFDEEFNWIGFTRKLSLTITVAPDKAIINEHTVTIDYEYADGSKAAAQHASSYAENDSYSITSPTIAGYKADKTVVSGTMAKSDVKVTVTYTKDETEIIESGSDNNGTANVEPTNVKPNSVKTNINGSSNQASPVKTGDDTNITNYMVTAALSFILVSLIALKKKFIKE